MEFKNTAKAMHVQAMEIVDVIARIEASEDMQTIEFDLLLEKLRRIYDLVYDIKASVSVRNISAKPEIEEKVAEKVISRESETVSKSIEPSYNDGMAEKLKSENMSSQINKTSIKSISGVMALNEKFELINELFSGDKAKFESTLETLNQADSFVEAYNYLNENYDWDMDSVYVQRILELIRRKLIVKRNEQ